MIVKKNVKKLETTTRYYLFSYFNKNKYIPFVAYKYINYTMHFILVILYTAYLPPVRDFPKRYGTSYKAVD